MKWRLNKILFPIYNLGDGKRMGIWVQGCSLGCENCLNRTLWNKRGGKSISIVDLFNWVVLQQSNFDGITISGGEPFQQYEQLMAFLYLIKMKTTLTVQCFTGYTLSELQELFPDKIFMKYIDILVDGRYIQEQHENTNLKGSKNQRIYKFINGVPFEHDVLETSTKWSININDQGQIHMAGIPKKNELKEICSQLARIGIHQKFK